LSFGEQAEVVRCQGLPPRPHQFRSRLYCSGAYLLLNSQSNDSSASAGRCTRHRRSVSVSGARTSPHSSDAEILEALDVFSSLKWLMPIRKVTVHFDSDTYEQVASGSPISRWLTRQIETTPLQYDHTSQLFSRVKSRNLVRMSVPVSHCLARLWQLHCTDLERE
jgi:hypothetical protein